MRRTTKVGLAVAAALLLVPFVEPERARIPVAGVH